MLATGQAQIPPAHQHIFTVVRTLLADDAVRPHRGMLRILDAGCGDGRLIYSIMWLAEHYLSDVELEIHGFDIGEHGFNDDHQMVEALSFLTASYPHIPWRERIRLVSVDRDWGYAPGYFDVVVSNQVIEHVEDLQHFFRNLRQVLRPGGLSVHFFPLRHCVPEAHCDVPFAHWIRDHEYRVAWIELMSRIGIGRYRYDRRVLGHASPRIHAEETAKFIGCWTSYRSFAELATEASRLHLGVSYHFTKDFFFAKLQSILRRPAVARYRRLTTFGIEWLGFMIGRYISSSTLIIQPLDYDIGARIAAEKADRLAQQEARFGAGGLRWDAAIRRRCG